MWQSGVSNCRFTLYRTLIDTLTHFTLLYIDTLLYRKTLIDTLPNSLPIFQMGEGGAHLWHSPLKCELRHLKTLSSLDWGGRKRFQKVVLFSVRKIWNEHLQCRSAESVAQRR